jgi:hypothetical protein
MRKDNWLFALDPFGTDLHADRCIFCKYSHAPVSADSESMVYDGLKTI